MAHVVYPREAFQNPVDAHGFTMEAFEGDVLLVWDDTHEANPEDKNKVVRKAITELRDLLAPDHDLHVLATGRIETEERIPGDRTSDDGLWRDVIRIELSDAPREELSNIIGNAADTFEVDVEGVEEAFLNKARRAEPTPMYVTSVLANAGSELTETGVDKIPESALEIWEDNYEELDEKPWRVLRSMKVLGDLAPGSVFPKQLVRGVYSEVFDGSEFGFGAPLETVLDQHWLIQADTDEGTVYGMHDVKRMAVDQDFDRSLVEKLSTFLENSPERYFAATPTSTVRMLHGNFALRVRESEWGTETAKKHHNYILDHVEEDDAVTYSNLGVLLKEEGELDEAKRRYRQAIEADPEHAKAHANLGVLLVDESAFDPAIDRLETSTRLWFSKDKLRNALNDMGALALAQFGSGNQLRALETCVTAIQVAHSADLPDESVEWAWGHLADFIADNPDASLRFASASLISGHPNVSYNLFLGLWEADEQTSNDSGPIAAVATAALHGCFDVEDTPPGEILSDVEPSTLSNPIRPVYECPKNGESDRIVDEELSVPEYVPYPFEADEDESRIEDVPLDVLVRNAFDALLVLLRE